jgi:hypothetical protein
MGDLQRHTREIHGVDLDGNPVIPHHCVSDRTLTNFDLHYTLHHNPFSSLWFGLDHLIADRVLYA